MDVAANTLGRSRTMGAIMGNDSVRCLDVDNRQIDCSETEYSPALALDIGYWILGIGP